MTFVPIVIAHGLLVCPPRLGEACLNHLHIDADTHHCTVREHRPRVCQRYSCANDGRIWTDFDNMVLNREWLDEHLSPQRPRLIRIQMHPANRPARATSDGGEP